jgi:hypothetical protein
MKSHSKCFCVVCGRITSKTKACDRCSKTVHPASMKRLYRGYFKQIKNF